MIQHTAIIDLNLNSDITIDFMFGRFEHLETTLNLVRAIKYVSNATIYIMNSDKKEGHYHMVVLKEDVMTMITSALGKPLNADERRNLVRNLIRSAGYPAHDLNIS